MSNFLHSTRSPKERAATFISQRGMHLLHQMFSKYPVHSQLASVRKKDIPSADGIALKLRSMDRVDPETMSLTQALEQIKSPSYLAQIAPGTYRIDPLNVSSTEQPVIPRNRAIERKAFKGSGRYKCFPFTTTVDASHLHHRLGIAYDFLRQGARIEFRLTQRKHNKFKHSNIDWAMENALHLRPDSILAAMPLGSKMFAKPCTVVGMATLMWGIEHPPSLERVGAPTSKYIYVMGTWNRKYEPSMHGAARNLGPKVPSTSLLEEGDNSPAEQETTAPSPV